MENTEKIRELNDNHRRDIPYSKTVYTIGINELWEDAVYEILDKVRGFRDFNYDNDPYETHEFGAFDYEGTKIYFKIDCFDTDYRYWSEDASDPKKTKRVLTILTADEY